ncbi:hypothetical protein YPPY66_1951, partial [Yersinia pestis PY-66]
MNNRSTVESY